ncbi:MAG: hypothetical protein GEU73_17380 [Chloroflexi bacterium]|nr:hypothetical protein [Chloroflexota bacterium]
MLIMKEELANRFAGEPVRGRASAFPPLSSLLQCALLGELPLQQPTNASHTHIRADEVLTLA